MHPVNERVDDRDEFTALLGLQHGPVITDTDHDTGNFIRADEILPYQLELIHCPGIEPRHGAGTEPPDPDTR